MYISHVLKRGLLGKKCIACGKKTKERVHHIMTSGAGGPGACYNKIVLHHDCHHDHCPDHKCNRANRLKRNALLPPIWVK